MAGADGVAAHGFELAEAELVDRVGDGHAEARRRRRSACRSRGAYVLAVEPEAGVGVPAGGADAEGGAGFVDDLVAVAVADAGDEGVERGGFGGPESGVANV